ncbi:MAG: arylsulfotransferase family protein [Thermoleophilia bacterium]
MTLTTEANACAGYTLYTPEPHDSLPGEGMVLVDMEGAVVRRFAVRGNVAMLPNGSVLGEPVSPDKGGVDQYLEAPRLVQVGWDGQVEWSFSEWDDYDGSGVKRARQHHDLQREGNPVGYYAPGQEALVRGRTLVLAHKNRVMPEISERGLVDDVVYEVDWDGNLTGFEWHAADHFEEFGFDESATVDIRRGAGGRPDEELLDWFHANCVARLGRNHWYEDSGDERFHPQNLILDSRHGCVSVIVDHRTGQVVWKVGPDFTPDTPEHGLGQLIGQHHTHMIPRGLPGAGNILVFDNGGGIEGVEGPSGAGFGGPTGYPRYKRDYSRILEFDPVSLEIAWEYQADGFFSHFISCAQRLPNGNTLITEGASGRLFEVTSRKDVVWEFFAPHPEKESSAVYRAYRIPPEWVPGNPSGYAKWGLI